MEKQDERQLPEEGTRDERSEIHSEEVRASGGEDERGREPNGNIIVYARFDTTVNLAAPTLFFFAFFPPLRT